MPERTALNETNLARVTLAISRANVVFPVPGGPQRMIVQQVLLDGSYAATAEDLL